MTRNDPELLAAILNAYDDPEDSEGDAQQEYDEAEPDPMGDPFEQAKWFSELDIME